MRFLIRVSTAILRYCALLTGREQLSFFARLIMEDTLSSVLSYIDGSSTFATQGEGEDFKLTSGEQVISGMLHDFFLATLEDEE